MIRAAERIRWLGKERAAQGAPSSIFGSALTLSQSIGTDERLRIGFYPILCAQAPEMAMGLAACLAYLLEQYPDTRIYRCFAKIDAADGSGEITSDDYQFSIDDWELAGLADNVQLRGAVEIGDAVKLSLFVDLDLIRYGEEKQLDFEYDSLASALGGLPEVAEKVMAALDNDVEPPALVSSQQIGSERQLQELLPMVFDWNLDLYLHLWNVDWGEENLCAQFDEMLALASRKDGDFAAWCLGMMAKQVMQPGVEDLGEALAERAYVAADEVAPAALPGLAMGLSALNFQDDAAAILRRDLDGESQASHWYYLGEVMQDAGDFQAAVSVLQDALEAGIQHPAVYARYAMLLIEFDRLGLDLQDVLLIDPDEVAEDVHIKQEIANALKLHLGLIPGNIDALQLALIYMLDAGDDELWLWFERLVALDQDGDSLSQFCESLLDLDDWSPITDILERLTTTNACAYLLLAQMSVERGDGERAADWVKQCRESEVYDESLEFALQQIEVAIALPGFAEAFAEMVLELRADGVLSNSQVELLEAASELAPLWARVHITLAEGYILLYDKEAAWEVMLDAQKVVGADPQIALALAQMYWVDEQWDKSAETLSAGLRANPNDVSLLVQTASFFIASDKMDEARHYIALAERIAPSNRNLQGLRQSLLQAQ